MPSEAGGARQLVDGLLQQHFPPFRQPGWHRGTGRALTQMHEELGTARFDPTSTISKLIKPSKVSSIRINSSDDGVKVQQWVS